MQINVKSSFPDIDYVDSVRSRLGWRIAKECESYAIAACPSDSGSLVGSIEFAYDDDSQTVQAGMNIYGFFVNFGVLGYLGNDPGVVDIDSVWGIDATSGSQFKFQHKVIGGDLPYAVRQSIALNGIKAEKFLPDSNEIQEMVRRFTAEYKKLYGK
jgi:hypothetical protein